MEFEEQLERAIQRGKRTKDSQAREAAERELSEEELRRLHTEYRLALSEHIEQSLARLPDHFPGFRYETVVSDRGWGAACSRDDVGAGSNGRRDSFYSRLEMVVRPFASSHVLELAAKGTIHNKEVFTRERFQRLAEADPTTQSEWVDRWILEYAELFAARS